MEARLPKTKRTNLEAPPTIDTGGRTHGNIGVSWLVDGPEGSAKHRLPRTLVTFTKPANHDERQHVHRGRQP